MMWANIYKKYKDHKEEVEKKGLSATPSNTLPWSAKRLQKLTMCKICIWLHQIYLPVVTATPFSALTICDYPKNRSWQSCFELLRSLFVAVVSEMER